MIPTINFFKKITNCLSVTFTSMMPFLLIELTLKSILETNFLFCYDYERRLVVLPILMPGSKTTVYHVFYGHFYYSFVIYQFLPKKLN